MTVTSASGAARFAGSRVHRVEDARLLMGRGTFVDDVVRPGMLHACFVRSPFARARLVDVDASAALALDGVHAVFTASDLNPRVQELWYSAIGKDVPDTPRPLMAEEEVRFVGDLVAMVVATDRYIAEDAAELIDVEYEPLAAVIDPAIAQDAEELVHATYPRNIAGRLRGGRRDLIDDVFDSAAHTVSEMIYQQMHNAVPMETRGIVAEWSAGELTVWAATQAPHEVRAVASRALGLDEHRIRVIMRDTGGGFGQKTAPFREDLCVLIAAVQLPVALKWIEDRRENLMSSGQARHEHATAGFAFAPDGTILGARIDHIQDVGAYPTPWPVGTASVVGMLFPGPYRVPVASWGTVSVFTNTPGRTAYRGPWAFETMAREVLLDIAARRIGIDPIELRRRNLLRGSDLPYTNPAGMPYDHVAPLEVFDAAIERLDLERFRREQQAARSAGRFIGVGTSSYIEPTAGGMGFYGTEGATIRIEPSGKVNVYLAGGSTGNSLETTAVQLTADALGLALSDVNTIQGDTAVTPYGLGTGGSRSGSMIAGAIATTAAGLRERIIAIAAHKLEAAPEDIELAESRATVRGTPSIGLSLAEVATIAYVDLAELPPGIEPGLEASGRYRAQAPQIWANATHVCTCEVDPATGSISFLRYIVSEDCGPMINPNIVEGQIDGGTVQGIGSALFEEMVYDEDGNPQATTFVDYLMPTIAEVPDIEHVHLETPGPGPGGYKGVGEGGAIGAPAAVVNAVADALAPFGATITRLPITPPVVLALIRAAAKGSA